MTYDDRKRLIERGAEIIKVIERALALAQAREALTKAGVPERYWL